MAHLEENGFRLHIEDVNDLTPIKNNYNIPPQLHSCHTAIVDGYIIEGHVPADDIYRLLEERPDIAGLAVPGMPIGSPGMEVQGASPEPFDVLAFKPGGQLSVFASYGR